ncbi:period circadian protein homolog 1 isoform X1 [Alligator sinensis]|uniref:Period circadian protein homolog 1 isoform X1 n=2 Tax=Alligator sinensis TaxID=38654 RepID=A0A3Q0G0G5_ALLSI|nr:period circadian protein homolog 1 isoform X1 [Alligator sinensis]
MRHHPHHHHRCPRLLARLHPPRGDTARISPPAFSLCRQGGNALGRLSNMSSNCEPGQGPFEGGGVAAAGPGTGRPRGQANDDMDANSNGSSGNESHGDSSLRSDHSSSGNGKDSALIETTESNKSTNSHSPSPPSSSIAYSLLSTSSEQDNPSTSGCSSEQSARVKTQKELMKALKEMKIRLPSEKRSKGKSGTLATLQYALSCVKQVQASQDYYQQWAMDGSQPCTLDMSSYTMEELENITSEYTLKNPDTFSVAVSFVTGRIVYVSEQAGTILRCKHDIFQGATFAEFLAPQDVSIFYGSTAPYHLPSWSACTSASAAAMDYTQEKSVFCRISGGHERGRELRYYPFRLTPYLAKVREADRAEGQPCCLLIAERIHSGYEAPRIPPDKRIFTTRHTPSCLFQDVDERAAPLLGYLPQDLIGMPVLWYLHPEDRPLMLAIHKKIVQYGGQPFDHSPLRFHTRHGEYVTIDTSWSSFVNPWSRKVSFIMGRHKVRTGPLNEDVFMAPKTQKLRPLEPDIQELSEQIHRLLLQPVHSTGSLGLCSLGSNGSHEQFLSVASSSDSNGLPADEAQALQPMTFQQICKDVHMVKNKGQQVFIESRTKPQAAKAPRAGECPGMPQQRKGGRPRRHGPSSEPCPLPCAAGLDVALEHGVLGREALREPERSPACAPTSEGSVRKEPSNYSYQQINCLDGIIRYLESSNLPSRVKRKCGSSSYTTSSTSDDDKQKAVAKEAPRKDIVMMEEALSATPPAPLMPSTAPATDREQYRPVGLTKEVLSVHTQKEEQAFLTRFHSLSQLRVFDTPSGPGRPETPGAHTGSQGPRQPPRGPGRRGRSGKSKAKRAKQNQLSDSTSSPLTTATTPAPGAPPAPPSWPPSAALQASLPPLPFPMVPTYPMPVFPTRPPVPEVPAAATAPRYPLPAPPFPTPLVAPMLALVLPNYVFPPGSSALPPAYFPGAAAYSPAGTPGFSFGGPAAAATPVASPGGPPAAEASRSTTPHSLSQAERAEAESPLFNSRCSSPLQLNLLQMEEAPKACERPDPPGTTPGPGTPATAPPGTPLPREHGDPKEACMAEAQDSSNNDALSSSSDLLDLLLQEDSRSGTGSAASGSGSSGSGSNGCSMSASGTSASGTTSSKSSHTSKYFGSVDSSETDLAKQPPGVGAGANVHLMKYVLQDPIWLLMANTDDKVMMTYQLPGRDLEAVLQQDREKLKQMQKQQPRFTEEQRKELAEVHTWVAKGLLPRAINVSACIDCGSSAPAKDPPPYDAEIRDLELSGLLEPMDEGAAPPDTAMEEEEAGTGAGPPAMASTNAG